MFLLDSHTAIIRPMTATTIPTISHHSSVHVTLLLCRPKRSMSLSSLVLVLTSRWSIPKSCRNLCDACMLDLCWMNRCLLQLQSGLFDFIVYPVQSNLSDQFSILYWSNISYSDTSLAACILGTMQHLFKMSSKYQINRDINCILWIKYCIYLKLSLMWETHL